MSRDVSTTTVEPVPLASPDSAGRGLRITLIAIIAVAALIIAAGVGWLARGDSPSATSAPSTSSVDAGFARDMSTHHTQAVTMAGYVRDNTTNPELKNLAFDIETSQQFQVGEMQGWLDAWRLSRNSPDPMSWMGSSHDAHGSGGPDARDGDPGADRRNWNAAR